MREEFFIPSNDGKTQLHGYIWRPEGKAKAVLQITHGMVEYIGRYSDFADYLAKNGIAVIGHDHLGHGQSVTDESKLGYFAEKEGYRIVLEDIHSVTEKAKAEFPGVPNFLLGHSMGSFMARRYTTLYGHDISGAIIMGTGYIPAALAGVGRTMSSLVKKLKGEFHRSKMLTGLALGSNNKPFEPARTPNDWLSRNEENVDRYNADPLCGYMFTTSAYVDFFTIIASLTKAENLEKMPKELPILLIAGEVDPVGGKAANESLKADYDKLGLKDVTLKLYPEDRHEILNEVDRETVYADIKAWIESKIA